MAAKAQPARQIGKAKLLGLVKKAQNTSARCAEECGALGAAFEAAATSDNFNAKALRPLMPLLKMDPGPQAHLWRTMMLYADHLGIGTQGDLEDVIAADEAQDEGEGEGEGEGGSADPEDVEAIASGEEGADAVADVLAGMTTPNLGRFRTALEAANTVEAVNKGLERFTEDHPDDADAALEMAQARLEAIDAEAGGGEDLRSTAQIEAERQKAADTVHATTGKKPSKRKASTRKDAGKVGQDAAPGFGQAVH